MARLKIHPMATRLALREYLPFASFLLAWTLLGLAIGHADVVRLIAANAFVQAVRAIATLEVMPLLGKRTHGTAAVYSASIRRALKFDGLSLLVCALLIALVVGFLLLRGMDKAAIMVAVIACAIPARHGAALAIARRNRHVFWKLGSSVVAVAGAGLVLLLGLHWMAAAIVLAARDWGGLLATALFADRRRDGTPAPPEPLTFAEAAGRTEASARRRLSYRLIKSIAGIALGPFGNIAARTGRSAGNLDSRLARLVPRNRPSTIAFTAITAAVGAFFLLWSREPSALLGGAAFIRLAATGGAILLWWNYADGQIDDEDDDDE